MKKLIALIGSLLVLIGVKAQTSPTIKKETVPATNKLALQDSAKLSSSKYEKHSPTEKVTQLDSAKLSGTKEGKFTPTSKEAMLKETKISPVSKEVTKPSKQ